MAIKVKITPAGVTEGPQEEGSINIKIVADQPDEPKPVTVEMVARRALNGDIMIFDHDLMDIVVSPQKNKLITFPKNLKQREVYPTQDRFYEFMAKKGVIERSSIQGGNVYSSLEAEIHESKIEGIDSVQTAIFMTSVFLEQEKPDIFARRDLKQDMLQHFADPDDENSTELGEIPQSDKKGSLDHTVRPYGYQYMYSVLRESEEK
jgi:hypothetical protein